MASTTTGSPALLTEVYLPGVTEVFYANSAMFDVFPKIMNPVNSSITWAMVNEGTNYAATTSEGGSAPSANVRSDIKLAVSKQAFQVVSEVTHELQYQSDPSKISDVWADTLSKDARLLADIINTTLLSTFESAIAATGSYGGQTRTSYSDGLVSYASSTTKALSVDDIETMVRTLIDANRGVRRSDLMIFASPTLVSQYAKASNNSFDAVRQQIRMQGDKVDGGYGVGSGVTHDGIPFVAMAEMTATSVICGPQLNPEFRGEIHVSRDISISPLGKVARADRALIDADMQFICKAPGKWGVLTNRS